MSEEKPKRQRNPNAPPRASIWYDKQGGSHDSPKAAKAADARSEVERAFVAIGKADGNGSRAVCVTDLLESSAAPALFGALKTYFRLTTEKSK